MDLMPLHPKLVHLPIALAVLMPLLSAGLWVAWWKAWLPRRGWWVAAGLQAVLVVAGLGALQSGEADEERVEQLVPETRIDAHEEAAQVFVAASAAVLVLAIASLLIRSEKTARAVAAAATLGTLAVFGLGYRTGEAGGRLVYQDGAAGAFASAGPAAGAPGAAEKDDDD